MKTFEPKLEILPTAQRRLWDELGDTPETFVLYGGTALALHVGHRESIDFDFFSLTQFDPDTLLESVPFLRDVTVTQKSPNTLTAIVERDGNVKVSFLGVPAMKFLDTQRSSGPHSIRVASILDIAGTKAAVVQKRAEAKDYIDIDAILRCSNLDLASSLTSARLIYGKQFNPELTLKALCYFGDGTLSRLTKDLKERLVEAVRSVDLERLPTEEIVMRRISGEQG